jgi:DNA-binding transcriptional ArsR family regulator
MSFKTSQLELRDARAMRALAHPLRIDLLRVLGGAPKTATECAEATGESPQSCSYHLRTLAKYGFVEPAKAPNGKERPWRKVKSGVSWSADVDADAARALSTTFLAHDFRLLQRYVAEPDDAWPEPMYTQLTLRLSYAEAEELTSKLFDLFEPYFARNRHDAPSDAKDVWWSSFGVPY